MSQLMAGAEAVKLNANLRKTLAIALPFNGREDFMSALENEAPDLRGLSEYEFYEYIQELVDMKLARVEANPECDDFMLIFASAATSYFKDSKAEVAKTIGRYCFQLLVGACGGLVALLLSNLG